MFKNSRKKVLTNRIRPLNQPNKVQVRELFDRRYYQVGFDIGLNITIFRDMISGFWYEQRV